jgi:hypothetical protein
MRGEKIMPSTQNAVNNHEYRSVPILAAPNPPPAGLLKNHSSNHDARYNDFAR